MHGSISSSLLAGIAPLAAVGGVVGFIYLVFVIYCAVVTFQKGHYLLFILGFFCGIAWIIGLLSRRRARPVQVSTSTTSRLRRWADAAGRHMVRGMPPGP